MLSATPGYCTLIASTRPSGSVARWTCPIDAAAIGDASKCRKRRRQSAPHSARSTRSSCCGRHAIRLVAQPREDRRQFGRQQVAGVHRDHLAELHRRAAQVRQPVGDARGVGRRQQQVAHAAAARPPPAGARPPPASRPRRRRRACRSRRAAPADRSAPPAPAHGHRRSASRHSVGRAARFPRLSAIGNRCNPGHIAACGAGTGTADRALSSPPIPGRGRPRRCEIPTRPASA